VTDGELLQRQADLQEEAARLVERLGLHRILGRAGRVVPLGSAVTGLMVWRDLDFGVDAPDLAAKNMWAEMLSLLTRCSKLRYVNETDDSRHYFVMCVEGWKIDVSIWTAGIPPEVESFQKTLSASLSDSRRLTILRLKDAWWSLPHYPEVVSAWEIYDAVMNHQVSTLGELDAYLAARGFPKQGT
jgi:hypothetical protein